jgi:hypothetical protein
LKEVRSPARSPASPLPPPGDPLAVGPRGKQSPLVHRGRFPNRSGSSPGETSRTRGWRRLYGVAGPIATARFAPAAINATARSAARRAPASSTTAAPSACAASPAIASGAASRPRIDETAPRCQQFKVFPAFFAYRCDRCRKRVDRPAHQLAVYCSIACRTTFHKARRRLLRRFPSLARLPRDPDAWLCSRSSNASVHGPPLSGVAPPDTLRPHESRAS